MKVARFQSVCRLGFTLIELMVVVILIAIMTAMIIPEMRGTFEDALLRSACRDLVNVFSIANSRAITLNVPHRVRLDTRTGRYEIERKVEDEERKQFETATDFVPVRDVPGGEGVVDQRISIQLRKPDEGLSPEADPATSTMGLEESELTKPQDAIEFYPDGTADLAEVVLQDRQGFRRALRINPTTARVRIVELERQGGP